MKPLQNRPRRSVADLNIEIVEMRAIDYGQVLELWQRSENLGQTETPSEFMSFLDRNPGISTIARDSQQILGAALCGHDGRRGYLYHLAVAQSHRNLGIGRAVVDRCLIQLDALGISRCSIHVYTDNEQGEAFWQRAGWRLRNDLKILAKDLGS